MISNINNYVLILKQNILFFIIFSVGFKNKNKWLHNKLNYLIY